MFMFTSLLTTSTSILLCCVTHPLPYVQLLLSSGTTGSQLCHYQLPTVISQSRISALGLLFLLLSCTPSQRKSRAIEFSSYLAICILHFSICCSCTVILWLQMELHLLWCFTEVVGSCSATSLQRKESYRSLEEENNISWRKKLQKPSLI